MPGYFTEYSVITKENYYSGAKNVYTKIAAGTNVVNPANHHVTVDGRVYYGGFYSGKFNFNQGIELINDLSDIGIDFARFEWLAQNLRDYDKNGYKVFVKTSGSPPGGGCWNMFHFLDQDAQGEDNGNTLVVFNTSDEICLTKTSSGRQFGPSVLAPFSKVVLRNEAGYIDGNIVAKKFSTVGGTLETGCSFTEMPMTEESNAMSLVHYHLCNPLAHCQ